MKFIVMILTAIIAFFSWIISPFVPERTEFVVDGKYVGFSSPNKLMDNFLLLTEAEDVDGIYTVFSPKAKKESENLKEKIPELIQFFNENMTSWETDGGYGESSSVGGPVVFQDYPQYLLYTDSTTYSCKMDITKIDTGNSDNEGFYSILIFPDGMHKYCSGFGDGKSGIYNLFTQTAKDNSQNLQKEIPDFINFINDKVSSWEFNTYLTEKGTISGENVIKRELVFLIHTDDETYRCNIRDVIEDRENGKNSGIYSIAIYPEDMYFEYNALGYYEPGLFRKSLTIKPSDDDVDGGSTITLTTSREAAVTCDKSYVKLSRKDPCTWESRHRGRHPFEHDRLWDGYGICIFSSRNWTFTVL